MQFCDCTTSALLVLGVGSSLGQNMNLDLHSRASFYQLRTLTLSQEAENTGWCLLSSLKLYRETKELETKFCFTKAREQNIVEPRTTYSNAYLEGHI